VLELLTTVAKEDDIPVLINIHEVELALDYADRIVGLSDGELVWEGGTDELDEHARDIIYRGGESREGTGSAVAEEEAPEDRQEIDRQVPGGG
jgi:phosphonate transport system ATP-binding protein